MKFALGFVVAQLISKLRTSFAPAKPLVMQRCFKIPILLSVIAGLGLLLSGCAMHFGRARTEPRTEARTEQRGDEREARAAAVDWLHLVDAEEYKKAFELEARDPRIHRAQDEFIAYMQAHRASFGRARSRVGLGTSRLDKYPGWGPGDYVTVLFRAAFEHKPQTAERVILLKQPEGWRVIDYQVY